MTVSRGCSAGSRRNRAPTTLWLLGAAALLLGAFAGVEFTRRGPLLDPRLLGQPQFLASITGALFTGVAVIGLMSYSPALMQRALRLSALGSQPYSRRGQPPA